MKLTAGTAREDSTIGIDNVNISRYIPPSGMERPRRHLELTIISAKLYRKVQHDGKCSDTAEYAPAIQVSS